MANERDTDRMATELLNALRGSINKPVAGPMYTQSQPQVDERSMLDTIKEFLNQSLPGTKEREKPSAQTTAQSATVTSPYLAAGAGSREVDWAGMHRRQEQERETMYERQVRERESTRQRHEKEMQAMAGIRSGTEVTRPAAQPPVRPPAQPVPRPTNSQAAGIVPGQTVGEWAVETENGTKKFMAISEEQAFREARRYGLTPSSAVLARIHTYTPEEKQRLMSSFGVPGQRESMEAEFEQAIKLGLIPETAQFERLPDREWGYRLGRRPTVYKGSDLVPRRSF